MILRKYAHTKAIKNYKGKLLYKNWPPSPSIFILSICLVYLNMFARFDEIPLRTLQDIKETKLNGRTDVRTDGRTT